MTVKKYEVVIAHNVEGLLAGCGVCRKEFDSGPFVVGLKTQSFFYVVCTWKPQTCCRKRWEAFTIFPTKPLAEAYAIELDQTLERTGKIEGMSLMKFPVAILLRQQ
ncbi:MAG TPA: hypothetical protein VEB18_04070 [Candidatus Paceibacterota bacterium]|nr:hypothetical protein [Candidatus Paceibacterota bacterium]